MSIYPIIIRKEAGSIYGVEFPDFPGCITAGATWEEAYQRAREALLFHIAGMLEDGEPIPEPSSDRLGWPRIQNYVGHYKISVAF